MVTVSRIGAQNKEEGSKLFSQSILSHESQSSKSQNTLCALTNCYIQWYCHDASSSSASVRPYLHCNVNTSFLL
jgi:hypothetical protein